MSDDDKNKAIRNLMIQSNDGEGADTLRSIRIGCSLGSVNNLAKVENQLEPARIGEYCTSANAIVYELGLQRVLDISYGDLVHNTMQLMKIEGNSAELAFDTEEERVAAIIEENRAIQEAVSEAAKDGVLGEGDLDRFQTPSGIVLPFLPGLAAIAGFDAMMQDKFDANVENTGLENVSDADLQETLQACYTAATRDTKGCYYNSAETARRIKVAGK